MGKYVLSYHLSLITYHNLLITYHLSPITLLPSAITVSRDSDARVEPAIDQARQRFGGYVGRADDGDAPLHEPVVAPRDAVFDEQQAESRPTENLLRDDRARQQHAQLQSENGD